MNGNRFNNNGSLSELSDIQRHLQHLQERFRADELPEQAAEMIDLRILGGRKLPVEPVPWSPDHDDRFKAEVGFAEINKSQLSAAALKAGILGQGGIIVRGLMDGNTVNNFKACISNSLKSPQRFSEDQSESDSWFRRSEYVAKGSEGPARIRGGDLSSEHGSVWAVDSPITAARLVDFYAQLGLRGILHDYFNEAAVLSVRKWVLRSVPPMKGGNKGWHQDGRFMGRDIKSINLWVALSECGEGTGCPGLELIADNRRQIHETGTHGAWLDWTVGPELVEKIAQDRPLVRPHFQPGDAIFFDHYCLHRTGEGPNDTLPRFALESWFFAESKAPAKQQPVLF